MKRRELIKNPIKTKAMKCLSMKKSKTEDGILTLASFVIVAKHVARGAQAERAADGIDALVGASTVAVRALVHVLASVIVRLQFIAGYLVTAALVTAGQIVAPLLAGTATAVRLALVYVCVDTVEIAYFNIDQL